MKARAEAALLKADIAIRTGEAPEFKNEEEGFEFIMDFQVVAAAIDEEVVRTNDPSLAARRDHR